VSKREAAGWALDRKTLERAEQRIEERHRRDELGFLDLPQDHAGLAKIQKLAKQFRRFKTLVVLGVGGSDLGARAVLQALPQKRQVVFAGDTTDPVALLDVLKDVDWKHAAINVISKSGESVETMAAFGVAYERLCKAVGRKEATKRVVATTDAERGTLRRFVLEEGCESLDVPSNVGGRFSVLSSVGLFPCAWAGVDVKKLLVGARVVDVRQALALAEMLAAAYQNKKTTWILMPYSRRLMGFALWMRQLVAESLGKKKNGRGTGPTPVVSEGPTDQHSQLQLYMDGPDDKWFLFFTLKQHGTDVRVPKMPKVFAGSGLSGVRLSELLQTEHRTTIETLASVDRPSGSLELGRLDTLHVGQLLQMCMLATCYVGELLGVNAFDQPGVEDSKRRIKEWLKRRPV
jgi:glucose-6-phosphate isomerase